MGEVISLLRDEYGIKRKPITSRNPQANSMVERAHKTLHNMINARIIKGIDDLPDPDNPWTGLLTALRFAMNSVCEPAQERIAASCDLPRGFTNSASRITFWHALGRKQGSEIKKIRGCFAFRFMTTNISLLYVPHQTTVFKSE